MSANSQPSGGRFGQGWFRDTRLLVVLLVIFALWWLPGTGLVSSNDGSHLALARALAIRGETQIDPDRDLCLRVDVARRQGHSYSDRPPGTAFLATPMVRLGAALDPSLAASAGQQGRILVQPARRNYARTYAARLRKGPALIELQATALVVAVHTRMVGLAGLILIFLILAEYRIARSRRLALIAAVGLASLWGPYSTMLFSHVTAATLLAALWLALLRDRSTPSWSAAPVWPLIGGALGALAIASDYLLLLAVVPLVALHAHPRRWPVWLAGAAPVAVLVAIYHQHAFGSPWAVGYDFQQNFDFARTRHSTFDKSPAHGLWILFGAGRGAGLLAQAPLWLAGLAGLFIKGNRRILLALTPWLLALAMHHTPWGGGTADHRYLLPAIPAFAVGLGVLWQHPKIAPRLANFALLALILGSAAQVWLHFLSWRG
ncbi:MAG: DMT family transporter [Myxococcales bacterium]|nr:DMT family transporter [Myxococcales bacterium]